MAVNYDFTEDAHIFLGEDKILRFLVVDVEGNPENVGDWAMTWVLRTSDKAVDPAILTKSTGGSGITVTGTYSGTLASHTQRVLVTLLDTDTDAASGVKPKTYRYSLKRTDDGFETILAYGDFVIRKVTAR
jgi:hypothetical protein